MEKRSSAIIGATGLTGSWLQQYLPEDPGFDIIRTLVRWPVEPVSPKQEVKLVDFSDAESVLLALTGVTVVFCAIGTTQKKVKGDQQLYRRIDHDIPVRACKLAMETGCRKFVLVSAVGANPESRNFYLRLKGQTEADIIATGMPAVHIMQPSQLLGKRAESRPLESFTQAIMKPLSGLFSGSWIKYRAIAAKDVARAMIIAGKKEETGVFRYTYKEMMELIHPAS
ncbi:NAD-dependent dehydratase [Niabella ginsenosidivorans]|uniref:NAD-dependent dehydratase n=1 Tax=Niabella ginsenosidivorans TaxID=1176587 RepID=A0A1A9I4R4_9BACT|nr:NAD(P)H-binding protein [Niabella ginsenosidivorans]ANH82039.1 NAD-dependent dehydratase [Niabella ginsenosidivorans]